MDMEERVGIACGELRLEGALERAAGTQGVVITHPHPLYGGDMDNPVVAAIRLAFRRKEFTTLRFNFRGVGESDGRHGRGVGERKDVQAAIGHLQALGVTEVDLAGYSFGSWVNAGVESGLRRLVMVSPPVAFMRFEDGLRLPHLSLVVAGDRDDFAPVLALQTACRQWNPQAAIEIVPGADHFYGGFLGTLEETIAAHI
jgi:alpha/beta superfamily hydrolase